MLIIKKTISRNVTAIVVSCLKTFNCFCVCKLPGTCSTVNPAFPYELIRNNIGSSVQPIETLWFKIVLKDLQSTIWSNLIFVRKCCQNLKELHKNNGEELDHDLDFHGMQTLEKKNKNLVISLMTAMYIIVH